jgi:hypothetical protein
MNSLLEELFMADEAPSGDKAIYVFIEMVALRGRASLGTENPG